MSLDKNNSVKIKLCGMFRSCDIDYMNEAMPDYTGFVFAQSKRQVTAEQAEQFRKRLCPDIKAVGVFVNEPIENIVSLVSCGIIDVVQLHGDEDAEFIERLKMRVGCPVIKAVRVRTSDDIRLGESTAADFLLLDKYSAAAYGGTGAQFDYGIIKNINIKKPFFLAGGLNMNNAAEAVKAVRPYAVDLSSGIETDGVKDREKILETVRRIRNV